MTLRTLYLGTAAVLALIAVTIAISACSQRDAWSEAELATLRSLSLGSLPQLPADPSNAFADDPRAADLGHQLFFDTRMSANGQVACASCHLPELNFTDGLARAEGVGTGSRKTMTVVGTAYSPWLFWDGRADSQWSQALGPLENPVEHAGSRLQYVHLIADQYGDEYETVFGPLPDLDGLPPTGGPVDDAAARANWESLSAEQRESVTRVFVNVGKAIAAYERLLMPGASRFDGYVEAVSNEDLAVAATLLSEDEIAGLRLFIDEAGCTNCHNGALFTNNEFHNTGVPAADDLPEDVGRALGAAQVLDSEFNCLSRYSDAEPRECMELRFLKAEGHELERAFKPPTLRNVAESAPYMHAGQFATLGEVLAHYNAAPHAPAGHSELEPLGLNDQQLAQLEAFLRSLSAPLSTPEELLLPPTELAEVLVAEAEKEPVEGLTFVPGQDPAPVALDTATGAGR